MSGDFITNSVFILAMVAFVCSAYPVTAAKLPSPKFDEVISAEDNKNRTIVLAGGCFWGVEGVYEHVKGVENAVSGYAGGDDSTANYRAVSRGMTEHAEAVQVTYNPKEVSLGTLLKIFFSVVHDPTQLNRQGPDVGPQYRSAIFVTDDEQQQVADKYIAQLKEAQIYKDPIVTQINKLEKFYEAERYHQDFMDYSPNHPYILYHDVPKVKALKKEFSDLYRDE